MSQKCSANSTVISGPQGLVSILIISPTWPLQTMALRALVALLGLGAKTLLQHPVLGPRAVQRLSESWPVRRAARFTAYVYLRGKQVGTTWEEQEVQYFFSGDRGGRRQPEDC